MTEQEYAESSDRVRAYSKCESLVQRLKKEQSEIDCGILEITTFYQKKIDCCGREEFVTRLKEALGKFYDAEIEKVEKEMESI